MMEMVEWLDRFGESTVLGVGGLLLGLLFGLLAQRSRFCLRAAVVQTSRGVLDEKLAVWLLGFATALVGVQGLIVGGALDVSRARQLAELGSVSGALGGGLLFGIGMVLARGCASRLLILSAQGNVRALVTGLVFALAAQATMSGAGVPLRQSVSQWWLIDGGVSRDVLALTGIGYSGGLLLGVLLCLVAGVLAYRCVGSVWKGLSAVGVGATVAAAWWWTYSVSVVSFELVPVEALTFGAPVAEWLMRLLTAPGHSFGFAAAVLPGVLVGALLGAVWGREWKLEGFQDGTSKLRYGLGAILMGFGAVLAGGCSVGAAVSGGAVFALTAWMSLVAMWVGGGVTDRLLDRA
jgi:uncharacterized protein